MRKIIMFMIVSALIAILAACGNNDANNNADNDELVMIDVDFEVPETAEVGETVTLKSTVTYKDEPVTDAETEFEIWLSGDEDNSEMIEPENNDDGTYTLDYTFEEKGIYEMYAHTTAENMHNMPKMSIEVGDVDAEDSDDGGDDHAHADEGHFHTEGFDLYFNLADESVTAGEEVTLASEITLDDAPLEDLSVQYEIQFGDDEDAIEWVKTEETAAGEYEGTHTFEEKGDYTVTVHVMDDGDLHEHTEETVSVN